jgi:hypothetical protein
MNTITLISLFATALLLLPAPAKAQETSARSRRKGYDYNNSVQWSGSPFDDAALQDDESSSLKKDMEDLRLDSEKNMPLLDASGFQNYSTMPAAPRPRNARIKEDDETDLLGEPVEDIKSIIDPSSSAAEDQNAEWGWLAEDILRERDAQGKTAQTEQDEDDFAPTGERGLQQRRSVDEEMIRFRDLSGGSSPNSETKYDYAIGDRGTTQDEQQRSDEQAGAAGQRSRSANQTQDRVFSQWEKELGLDKPVTPAARESLRSSYDITQEIKQRMLQPPSDVDDRSRRVGEATLSTQPASIRRETFGFEQGGGWKQDEQSFIPSRQPESLSSSSALEGLSDSRLPSFSPGLRRDGSAVSGNRFSPSGYNAADSSLPSLEQPVSSRGESYQSISPKLDSFRKLHKSDGTYRPFGGSSSSWAD